MLDYHVHLWEHTERAHTSELSVANIARYCEVATSANVAGIAITEHIFRFVQGRDLVKDFWEDHAPASLREGMAAYFSHHATVDLHRYVEVIEEAKADGLPVVLGLEVDYYEGQMDEVKAFLAQFPFDVILGSVHWLGNWRFDHLEDPESLARWQTDDIDDVWRSYAEAIEYLADSGTCDVLAHVDLAKITRHFPSTATFQDCYEQIINAAFRNGLTIELSSAGWRKPVGEAYPSNTLLEMARKRDLAIVTASDAHSPKGVGQQFSELRKVAEEAGYVSLRAFRSRVAFPVLIDGAPTEDVEP